MGNFILTRRLLGEKRQLSLMISCLVCFEYLVGSLSINNISGYAYSPHRMQNGCVLGPLAGESELFKSN